MSKRPDDRDGGNAAGQPSGVTNKRSGSSTVPSSTPPVSTGAGYRGHQKISPMMNTIDSSGTDNYGNDNRQNLSIFNSLYDDSELNDSLVFDSRGNKVPSPGNREVRKERERFPSFDSMASSGSLVRHGPQHRSNVPSPQAPKVTQQNLAHVNPQMLPYDQRRKLMKMKQQQQQKKQQQTQKEPSPPPAPRPNGRYPPSMMPPDNPYVLNGVPMAPPPHQQHFMYPMPPQPMHMQMPYGAFPPPPNARLSPYRSAPPRYDPNRPPPQAAKQGGRLRQYPPQQMPQNNAQVPPAAAAPAPPQHTLPPSRSGISRQPGSSSTRERIVQSSSLDSSDQDYPAKPGSRPSEKNNNAIPPPPPPPPPMPPHHVRAESSGSVSSLGSQGSMYGYLGSNDDDPKASRGSKGKNSFLQMLNPFSPKNKKQPSPQEAALDFHRHNQEFLKKSAVGRPTMQPSPKAHHQRVRSMEGPPTSRGTHKRLPSIENDNWDDSGRNSFAFERVSSTEHSSGGNGSSSSQMSSSEDDPDEADYARGERKNEANERTSLLPPPGQGSSEHLEGRIGYRHRDSKRSSRRKQKQRSSRRTQRQQVENQFRDSEVGVPRINVDGTSALVDSSHQKVRSSQRKQKKKKHRRRSRRSRNLAGEDSSQSSHGSGRHSSSSSSYDYRQWTRRRAQMLEDERAKLIAQWKAEAREEALASRRKREADQWHRRLGRYLDSECGQLLGRAAKLLMGLEAFICNLPLTVGAIAMAIVLLGVTWFKFAEETLSTCEPVQFHSSQCTFPEFPGCFYCDTTAPMYKLAVNFHFACSAIGGVLALSYILKALLAFPVVLDELSSPTTASPAGLICMTTVCVWAGRGVVGQIMTSLASIFHLGLVVWFTYMALAYHIMPTPDWYPNTVGIGMSAVKTWLYYPMSGHFLMAISISLNFFFFPISLLRVFFNEKISATVCYMQMSAPAISLYALTIMAQPSFEQEKPDINRFQRAHRLVYLPAMHFLFALSVIGLLASFQALLARWKDFRKREFSPAHAAFCYPTLLHANAIQAYRAAINSFSNVSAGSPWKLALEVYWVIVLTGGTLVTIWITVLFFYNLPRWTNIDVEDEEEPPAPYETTMTLQNIIATGESLVQPFVSPAVLQANETGALVLARRAGSDNNCQRFVRTRKQAALGFEPTMELSERERERDLLLEWVEKHPPRRRNRNLSVPGIDFNNGPDFGLGHSGVYGIDVVPQDVSIDPTRARHCNPPSYQGESPFF